MRVKRLEIQGFKSFKDKTVIHFDHGITGIVGPNGCGKSNIVDAFFWVMGEQSYKHMRGSSSDDLIFNGSSKYSPLGLAEATMVLETDAVDSENAPAGATAQDIPVHLRSKEIAVTRRLYRGGEGEYFINGLPARLKDIQELFMDTGVGAKGYSVIEQGQIGKIVNAKPEERRLLIEEAAGIAKYKKRKQESLRKMEATESNLSRLTDVVQEIERTLNSLERQAQKARQYKKYKDELIDKEMTWGRRKTQIIRVRLETLKKDKEALEQELAGMRAELSTRENEVEVDRIAQLTDSKIAEDWQLKIQKLAEDLTHEKSALDLSRRRQSDLAQQLEGLDAERTDLLTSIETEKQKLVDRENETRDADVFFAEAAQKAQAMDQEVRRLRQETEAARREVESTKSRLLSGITQASDLTSRSAVLASRVEQAASQTEKLTREEQIQAARAEEIASEATRAREEAVETKSRAESLESEKRDQNESVQAKKAALREVETARDAVNRELTQNRSRLQSLEELADAFEGFGDGPKAALEWARAKNLSGVTAMAEAFDVESGYETVLESWLESRLESLLIQDPANAIDAIRELRSGSQGRVSVQIAALAPRPSALAWDLLKGRLESSGLEVLGELGAFARPGSDSSAHDAAIAASLVAHVAVVRSMDGAAALLADLGQLEGWSIVDLEGSSLDTQEGTLRGGSRAKDSGASVLKRKRAIADLKAVVAEIEGRASAAEKAASDAREELELATARLQQLQAEIQEAAVQAAALQRDVVQYERAATQAEQQLESTREELQFLAEESRTASTERAELEEKIAVIISSRAELEAQIAEGDARVTERDTAMRAQEAELGALRVSEAQLRERAGSLKREVDAGRALITDRERRVNEINRTLERVNSEREHFTDGQSGIVEKIEVLTRDLAEAREELSAVKDRIEQVNARISAAHERAKELHKAVELKSGDSTSATIEVEKLAAELNHLVINLEEKYGPGCLDRPAQAGEQQEMIDPVVTTEMTAEEEQLLGEEVERLRERIRRLGEVNPGAVEEYEEVKKRYDYLLTERGDLETSIKNLQEAIEHINKTSEDRFKRAFDAIADRFERLFPIIFGGGQARLSLVYPEGSTEILDAGVDILAQPPGKKVVNIGLLSGGEKALTAVSLIFAIFMVKPSPFCVLDEVDAPLDDANIGKFNALLREMSSKSQFILITHNKKTMELNDTLYGVTMEEPGVSKMVSIEMR